MPKLTTCANVCECCEQIMLSTGTEECHGLFCVFALSCSTDNVGPIRLKNHLRPHLPAQWSVCLPQVEMKGSRILRVPSAKPDCSRNFSTHSSSRIKLFFNGNVRPDSLQTVPSALKAGRRTHFWACTRTFRAHHSVWSYSPCPSAPLRAALRRAAPRCCHFTTTFHSASDKSSAPLQLHLIHNSLSQFPQSVPEAT